MVAKMSGQDPGPKRSDLSDESEPMIVRTKALMAANAEERSALTTQLGLYWGSLVNANKVIFWMLLEILRNPDVEAKIRTEIAVCCKVVDTVPREGGFGGFGPGQLKMDINALMKSCPILRATFYETMRLYTDNISYCKVMQDLTLTKGPEDVASFGKPTPPNIHHQGR